MTGEKEYCQSVGRVAEAVQQGQRVRETVLEAVTVGLTSKAVLEAVLARAQGGTRVRRRRNQSLCKGAPGSLPECVRESG